MNINWKKLGGQVIEVLGIMLSILAAFAIENYDEELEKVEKEEIYLVSLHSDLMKDYNELTEKIREYEQKLGVTIWLLNTLKEPETCDRQQVLEKIDHKLAYNFRFVPSNNTYKALESSGDIKFITNARLKLLLFELDRKFGDNNQQADYFIDFTNSISWAGFLIDCTDEHQRTLMLSDDELKTDLFNRVKRMNMLIETYYYDLLGIQLKIQEVQDALEQELEDKELEVETIIEEVQFDEQKEEEQETEELEDLLDEL
jgi:hypothetical protein